MTNDYCRRRPRILLGITGSIAAVKGPRLAVRLATELKAHVKIVLTRTVENYFWKAGGVVSTYEDGASWNELQKLLLLSSASKKDWADDESGWETEEEEDWELSDGQISLHYAEEEWNGYQALQDPILHIKLRNWADLCLIAPLSAHTLAKLANGLCDDLLTCCLRAWDFGQRRGEELSNRKGKPVILAPAMNTAMWEHPLTQAQLQTIQLFWKGDADGSEASPIKFEKQMLGGVVVVDPAVKLLACGEMGRGALADLDDILFQVKQSLIRWTERIDWKKEFALADYDHSKESSSVSVPLCEDEDASISSGCSNYHSSSSIDNAPTCLNQIISSHQPKNNLLITSKKDAVKKALLLVAKRRFHEMQINHEQKQLNTTTKDLSTSEQISSSLSHTSSNTIPSPLLAAPVSPTPQLIIETFLPYLKLTRNSFLIDLGCGDGRWLIAAAKISHCTCIGIDVDAERLRLARQAIERNFGSLEDQNRVQVRHQDVFDFIRYDEEMFWKADAFVLYLFRDAMVDIGKILRERLFTRRRSLHDADSNGGITCTKHKVVRILSVGFALPGWIPDHEEKRNGIRVYLYSTK